MSMSTFTVRLMSDRRRAAMSLGLCAAAGLLAVAGPVAPSAVAAASNAGYGSAARALGTAASGPTGARVSVERDLASPATIIDVSPASGTVAGGTPITVAGIGFAAGDVVEIGQGNGAGASAIPATNVDVISSNELTATTGGGAVTGVFNIYVVSAGLASSSNSSDLFNYTPGPAVAAVNGPAGPTDGGTLLTITGTGFLPGDTVEIGQGQGAGPTAITATNVDVISSTEITAMSGGNANVGTFNTYVVRSGFPSTPNPNDRFTYVQRPAVTRVSPSTGPTGGGTRITIFGTGFLPGEVVELGQGRDPEGPDFIRATDVVVISPNKMRATTGGGALAGQFDTYVLNAGVPSQQATSDAFTYTRES